MQHVQFHRMQINTAVASSVLFVGEAARSGYVQGAEFRLVFIAFLVFVCVAAFSL